ncbi:p28-like protein [Canarypox virus]|uniref:CNPV207 N1R/p28-like protein n=1 Tax=Canarypox virus TaxID=44088 RepID=Q6VZE0_CNPV|nr:p28-like protein [Canarypox virus]AAR83553.1 CNPV207 N1R/p28-like protein [Canarypox virus]AWD84683.1 p28-like protein [Canarypox virus]
MDIITCCSCKGFNFVTYNDVSLIIMKSNNYINATKLCDSQKKDFRNWKKLSTSKFLIKDIKEINNQLKTSNKDMIIEVKEGNNSKIQGFYVHQDLIYPIAYWISPIFAIKVNKIINYYLYNDYEIMVSDFRNLYKETDIYISTIMDIMNSLASDYYETLTEVIEKLNKFNSYVLDNESSYKRF